MLVQALDRDGVIEKLVGDPIRGFTTRNFCRAGGDWQPIVLVDNQQDPKVLVAHRGSNFAIYGAIQHYMAAMDDLFHGRVEQEPGWPDAVTHHDWEEYGQGRRYIFINSSPYVVWRSALEVGFEPDEGDLRGHVAFMWFFTGQPRFSGEVHHSCRLGVGLELLELLKLGIGYDQEGHYIKVCLENGPSFVCEAPDENGVVRPVCWSSTHLNHTMGMIYTPPELRRHGYARSLAAFQIDYMLARDGLACCHVVDKNVASMSMVAGLGGQRWEEPVVWRGVRWPSDQAES